MNPKDAVVAPTVADGPLVIVGIGGTVVSTVQFRVAAAEVFSSASLARTSKECAPSARAVKSTGDVQTAKAAASSRHSNVTPASVSEKANDASVEETLPVGPALNVGTGGAAVSTDQARVAEAVFPAASFARTS